MWIILIPIRSTNIESGFYKNMIDRPDYELGCHDGDPFKSVCALSMYC